MASFDQQTRLASDYADWADKVIERNGNYEAATAYALTSIANSLCHLAGDGIGSELKGVRESLDGIDLAIQNLK